MRLGARLSKPHTSDVTIPLTMAAGTGKFDSVSSIRIPAGATKSHVWIRTHHDADENDERFGVTASDTGFPPEVELGPASGVLFTILDDEPLPKVSLSATPNPVDEGRPVEITATLTKAAPEGVRIPLWEYRGSAEFLDYGEVVAISIRAGETSGSTTVTTLADSDADDESFGIGIGNIAVTPCTQTETWCTVAKGSPSRVDITIEDGTEPEITLTADRTTVAEGGEVTVTLTLSEPVPLPANESVLIPVMVRHLAAEPGDLKFVAEGVNHVRMDGGMTSQVLYIGTAVDGDGDDESFAVQLDAAASGWPAWATVGTPSSADILITDPDDADSGGTASGLIQMRTREISVRESGTGAPTIALVPVWLSRAATQEITVHYETGFGDADEPADYEGFGNSQTNPPSTLTFAAGETSKEITIRILDDTIEDSGENFCVVFQNLAPASVVEWGGESPCVFNSVRVYILNEEADLEDLKLWGAPDADGPYERVDFGVFDMRTTDYAVTVPHGTTHAKIAGVSPPNETQTLMAGHYGSPLTAVGSGEASPELALAVGGNHLVVEATGATGEQKTYSVTVTRQQAPQTPSTTATATLSALRASTSPDATGWYTSLDIGTFDSGTTSYAASVDHSATHVKLTPTATDGDATVKVGTGSSLTAVASGSASEAIALSVGDNAISVEVTDEDGATTRTYTVTVTRQEDPAESMTVATLSALTADTGAGSAGPFTALDIGTFASGTTSYAASVDHSATHVRLTPTATDADATVKVGTGSSLTAVASGSASEAIGLSVGDNAIVAEVTAEDGTTTQTYTVTVTRQEAQSTGAALSGLTVSNSTSATGTFAPLSIGAFASGTASYTVSVDHTITHVKLTPTAADADATVKVGTGSSLTALASGTASEAIALATGDNAIVAEVTAEDGTTTRTYTVTVTRQEAKSIAGATLSGLRVSTSTSAAGWYSSQSIGTFASTTTSYTATVDHSTSHARLTPTATHDDATVRVGTGSSLTAVASGTSSEAIGLSVGDNAISVEVTSEDGTATQTYIVTLTRQEATSAVASLSGPSGPPGLTAEDGTAKTHAVRAEDATAPPLTASFENVPEEHDGSVEFALDVRFSEALGRDDYAPTAASFDVGAGTATAVEDLGGGLWRVRVRPDSWPDTTVTLADGRGCGSAGAVCTADGRALSNTAEASVAGPVRIRIDGGQMRDGDSRGIDFAVTLNRASAKAVSVDYATADGTATAGEDYEASSGTLTFPAGETDLTLRVAALDSHIASGGGSFSVHLSNPSGAYLRDMHRKTSATIRQRDPIPQAWLARFGRTATDHVVDALGSRFDEAEYATGHDATLGVAQAGFGQERSVLRDVLRGSSFRSSWGDQKSHRRLTAWGPRRGHVLLRRRRRGGG